MHAVLFLNGIPGNCADDFSWMKEIADKADLCVGVDGGTRYCLELGLTPDVVIGDLDSLEAEYVTRLEELNIPLERHPCDKDKTDLELGIELAISRGAKRVTLLASLAGRLDQAIGNVLALTRQDMEAALEYYDGRFVVRALWGGESLAILSPIGTRVSCLPIGEARGVTNAGLKWPLNGAVLEPGSGWGMSNMVEEHPAMVSLEYGLMLLVEEIGSHLS